MQKKGGKYSLFFLEMLPFFLAFNYMNCLKTYTMFREWVSKGIYFLSQNLKYQLYINEKAP